VDVEASFEYFVQQKQYVQALVLAYRFKELQQLPSFAKLQEEFTKRLQLAALYLKKGKKEEAQELLGAFKRVEEKKLIIELLFTCEKEFLNFLQHTSNGDVMQAYAIAKKDARFQKLSLYKTLEEKIEHTLDRIEEAMKACQFVAKEILLSMQSYPRAKQLLQIYNQQEEFYTCYKKGDILQCYVMMDEQKELQNNIIALELEQQWQKILQDVQYLCKAGNFLQVVQTFGELKKIPTRKKQVGIVLRKALREQIVQNIKHKKYGVAEKEIYYYLELFGKDVLFADVMELFERESGITLAIVENMAKDEYAWMKKL
jgi:hypothetical protein